jgi:hypothetical protein
VSKSARRNRLKAIRLQIVCLVLALSVSVGYLGLPKRESSLESVEGQRPAMAVSSHDSGDLPATADCSADDLRASLVDYAPSRTDANALSGYRTLPVQNLGGALVIDFVCEDSKTNDAFRSMWILSNRTWALKEISRPPSRQPGDF